MNNYQGIEWLIRNAVNSCESLLSDNGQDITVLFNLIDAVCQEKRIDSEDYQIAAEIREDNTARDEVLCSLNDPDTVRLVRQHLAECRLKTDPEVQKAIQKLKGKVPDKSDRARFHNVLINLDQLLADYQLFYKEFSSSLSRAYKIANKAQELADLIRDDPYWNDCLTTGDPDTLDYVKGWNGNEDGQSFLLQNFLYGFSERMSCTPFAIELMENYMLINGYDPDIESDQDDVPLSERDDLFNHDQNQQTETPAVGGAEKTKNYCHKIREKRFIIIEIVSAINESRGLDSHVFHRQDNSSFESECSKFETLNRWAGVIPNQSTKQTVIREPGFFEIVATLAQAVLGEKVKSTDVTAIFKDPIKGWQRSKYQTE